VESQVFAVGPPVRLGAVVGAVLDMTRAKAVRNQDFDGLPDECPPLVAEHRGEMIVQVSYHAIVVDDRHGVG
jgi:hypothetical protein